MALSTPESDRRGFRDSSPGLRAVVICALSIVLMVADSRNHLLTDVRRILAAAVYPVQVLIDSPIALGRWLGSSLASHEYLLKHNAELQRQILEQSGRLQRMAALEKENARLRALLDSNPKVSDRVLIAEILSVDMNPFRHRIIINKGDHDDVFVGQALIDANGIVGQVTRDQVFTAEAILITDVEHALPVEILRNRQRTVAVGTGKLDALSLPFLPRNADVKPGDQLVTSGLGGTFPPGYPVGTVVEVKSTPGEPFLAVRARPAAQLSRIREVLLIWPGEQTTNTSNGEQPPGRATMDETTTNMHAPEQEATQ